MKTKYITLALVQLAFSAAFAGNPERQGQAGAAQLTINGFGKSSAMGWAYGGGISGVEALFMNPAGIDKAKHSTEILFCRSNWLAGSGIGINNFGFTQKLGDDGSSGTLGVSLMQFAIKPIDITTEQNPDGGIGTYRVSMTNIGVGYAKSFGRNISAGINFRAVTEGIPDAKALGMSLDAGVQYATTLSPSGKNIKQDDVKFGITLKNIGPDMRHTGDGLSYKAILQDGTYSKTVQVKVDRVKLPALLNIAGSYDLKLDRGDDSYDNRLTLGFGFTNYAFQANQTTLGVEYSYKNFISVRGSYVYQEGSFDKEKQTTAFTGLSGGLSMDFNSKNGDNLISLDYSYRATNFFNGVHSFGLRIGLGAVE